ncbi:hypothetical protein ACVWY3_001485 [Bradyrhizobium sp. USDA 4486]
MKPEARGRHEHLATIYADPEIAGERKIGRAAIDSAVQSADGRYRQSFELIDDVRKTGSMNIFLRRVSRSDVSEVVSSAERASFAGQDENSRTCLLNAGEVPREHGEIGCGDLVHLPRAIELDRRDRPIRLQQRRAAQIHASHRRFQLSLFYARIICIFLKGLRIHKGISVYIRAANAGSRLR